MAQDNHLNHLQHLDACLADVDDGLKEIMKSGLREQLDALPSAADRAKFLINVAYAINSLFFGTWHPLQRKLTTKVSLRTQGHITKEHPVMAELDRVKTYFKKLAEVSKPRPRELVLDKDASKRFVTAALGLSSTRPIQSTQAIANQAAISRPETPSKATPSRPPSRADSQQSRKEKNKRKREADE